MSKAILEVNLNKDRITKEQAVPVGKDRITHRIAGGGNSSNIEVTAP